MEFVKTRKLHVNLLPFQSKYMSSSDDIKEAIKEDNVTALDIIKNGNIIGFVMIKNYGSYINLSNYAIDCNYQNKGNGKKLLDKVLSLLDSPIYTISSAILELSDTSSASILAMYFPFSVSNSSTKISTTSPILIKLFSFAIFA